MEIYGIEKDKDVNKSGPTLVEEDVANRACLRGFVDVEAWSNVRYPE